MHHLTANPSVTPSRLPPQFGNHLSAGHLEAKTSQWQFQISSS